MHFKLPIGAISVLSIALVLNSTSSHAATVVKPLPFKNDKEMEIAVEFCKSAGYIAAEARQRLGVGDTPLFVPGALMYDVPLQAYVSPMIFENAYSLDKSPEEVWKLTYRQCLVGFNPQLTQLLVIQTEKAKQRK